MALTTSPMGIDFIKKHEGCKLQAYLCPANKWTIGYGTTFLPDGRIVRRGMKITKLEADEALIVTIQDFERGVRDALNEDIKKKMQRYQFDALVSFAYNVGIAAFKQSTLLKLLNQGAWGAVPSQLMRWIRGGGKTIEGLINRRKAEVKLWETGDYGKV